ncbi:MAG: vanadium-dependent haloperoxidase [Armatimonadetes bacterium]|nr:vanadium-dependent haloperoxidase [Armatimonadota bacterium]
MPLSRREFLRAIAVAAAAVGADPLIFSSLLRRRGLETMADAATGIGRLRVAQGTSEEPYAGNWSTWVLRSAREMRLPSPPAATSLEATRELAQLKQAQLARTEAQIAAARFWDTGPATRRWTEIQLEMIKNHRPNPPRASRGLALVHIAMFDALIAAWHAKYAYRQPAPTSVDSTLVAALRPRADPSYPSEHAVAAGAASQVLKYLFPQQGSAWFEAKAQQAAMSRIWAGVDWPGAVEQGLALGRTVADKVLARAAADGADTPWDGKRLTGICYWKPTQPGLVFPPLEPSWGKVKPWLLASADQLRPGPPPGCGTAGEHEQYLEVYRTVNGLTDDQKRIALFWNDGPGTFTPPGHWFEIALDLVERYDLNTPRAARIFAHLGAVVMTAGICVWDAKYAYWSPRPVTYIQDFVDANWTSVIPTPPFPGYVSGHSGFSGGAAELLGYAFPRDRAALRSMAAEAAMSRLYGGIHIRADNDVGLAMGKLIGALAGVRALGDDVEDLAGKGALDRAEADALNARLAAAATEVNQRNLRGAIAELQGFISQANASLRSGDREPLITAAREIIAQFAPTNQ